MGPGVQLGALCGWPWVQGCGCTGRPVTSQGGVRVVPVCFSWGKAGGASSSAWALHPCGTWCFVGRCVLGGGCTRGGGGDTVGHQEGFHEYYFKTDFPAALWPAGTYMCVHALHRLEQAAAAGSGVVKVSWL